MPTPKQLHNLYLKIKQYSKKYLSKNHDQFDESATRIMTNSLLTTVLGYEELDEIRTEYAIQGGYADYVIELNRKKQFVVEVKAITLDLTEKHLRQAVNYAANEGIDWVILTNGKAIELYKVLFQKPIEYKKIFSCDLTSAESIKNCLEYIFYLTKQSLLKKELDGFWTRFKALEPNNLSQRLYNIEIIKFFKKSLKKSTGLSFSEEDILNSLYEIIVNKIPSVKPNLNKILGKPRKTLITPVIKEVSENLESIPTLSETN